MPYLAVRVIARPFWMVVAVVVVPRLSELDRPTPGHQKPTLAWSDFVRSRGRTLPGWTSASTGWRWLHRDQGGTNLQRVAQGAAQPSDLKWGKGELQVLESRAGDRDAASGDPDPHFRSPALLVPTWHGPGFRGWPTKAAKQGEDGHRSATPSHGVPPAAGQKCSS
ncbi:hypothetical protein LY40_002434 [Prauserella salsuginis]|nr:hypothetical protein [Prauserella salsuginis]